MNIFNVHLVIRLAIVLILEKKNPNVESTYIMQHVHVFYE